VIPFLGVLLRDLVFLDQGNEDILPDGLLNIEKMRMEGKLIDQGLIKHQYRTGQIRNLLRRSSQATQFLDAALEEVRVRVGNNAD
ncbi:hypothetical protein GM535_13665, partial [Streptococcus pneumoniae]